jgi:hypothetical protein
MVYIALGVLACQFGVGQLVFAAPIHTYFARRNQGRSLWRQNPRGWSVGMVRYAAGAALVSGLFLIAFGASQIQQ